MAFSTGYTFGFAAVVCVVCSLSVATLSLSLKDMQDDNRRRDLQGNILGAVGIPEDGRKLTGDEIDTLYEERIEFRAVDASGKILDAAAADKDGDGDVDPDDEKLALAAVKGTDEIPDLLGVYVRKDGKSEGAYAIPVNGKGLWGPISGYIALDPKAREVTGVTFFAPKETPGLGYEITTDKFKAQWVGEKVVDDSGAVKTITVYKGQCPGGDADKHCVDGVSGATITSRGVDDMVAEALDWYDPYLKQLRGS